MVRAGARELCELLRVRHGHELHVGLVVPARRPYAEEEATAGEPTGIPDRLDPRLGGRVQDFPAGEHRHLVAFGLRHELPVARAHILQHELPHRVAPAKAPPPHQLNVGAPPAHDRAAAVDPRLLGVDHGLLLDPRLDEQHATRVEMPGHTSHRGTHPGDGADIGDRRVQAGDHVESASQVEVRHVTEGERDPR
jgi:hypothetical protein